MKKRNIHCYKLSSERLNLLFMLHRTVWGVSPASSNKKTQHMLLQISSERLKLLFMLLRTVWGVPPASSDEKMQHVCYKLSSERVKPTFHVTSNCMRCATRQFRWQNATYIVTKLSRKWLNLLFMLRRTVWGVSPASSDEKRNIHFKNYLVND